MTSIDSTIAPSPAVELLDVECSANGVDGVSSLAGIHWTVTRGEFWVVGGLLGAGKTSLLSTIAGVHAPRRGVVRVMGADWSKFSADELSLQLLKIGFVQGGGLLLRHLSVCENIGLPLRYHHNASHEDVMPKVREWLAATELEPYADRAAGKLSPHWAQRAGLARACTVQPEILLFDNPLSGLDPIHARWWIDFLGRLAAGHPLLGYRRPTIIVTCDHLPTWRAEGRRYAELADGQLRILDAANG